MYYTINEETARRAKVMNSFYEYVPGSATAEYQKLVDEAEKLARQVKELHPECTEKIDSLFDLYARKLTDNINKRNEIETRYPSVMIAGPAKFSARKKEQQNAARDKNWKEYDEVKAILGRIRSTGTGGVSADDPNAIEKLKERLAEFEKKREEIKSRVHTTLQLQNVSANIKRIKDRITTLENRKHYEGWTFEGGEVVINEELNRVQIKLDSKPESTEVYKRNGFRWSPREKAWQRQLTDNGVYAAREITQG